MNDDMKQKIIDSFLRIKNKEGAMGEYFYDDNVAIVDLDEFQDFKHWGKEYNVTKTQVLEERYIRLQEKIKKIKDIITLG